MISFEDFDRYINILRNDNDFINRATDLLHTDFFFENYQSIGLAVELLSVMFDDLDADWIGYWVFELDFGESYKDGCVTEEDGTIIPLRTVEDLYNFLVSNYKEGDTH